MRNSLPLFLILALCRPAFAGSGAHGQDVNDWREVRGLGARIVPYCLALEAGVVLSAEEARAEIEEAVREWREVSERYGNSSQEYERTAGRYRLKLRFPDGRPAPIAWDAPFVELCPDPAHQIELRFSLF